MSDAEGGGLTAQEREDLVYLRSLEEQVRKEASARRASAATFRSESDADWEAGRRLAQRQTGRKIPGMSHEERLVAAERHERIAQRHEQEAEQISRIASRLSALQQELASWRGPGWDEKMEAASLEIADLRELVAALQQENERLTRDAACSTCGGNPHPSGLVCVCSGTNKAWKEAEGLREELVRRQMDLGEFPHIPAKYVRLSEVAALQQDKKDAERWRFLRAFANEPTTDGDETLALIAGAVWDGIQYASPEEAVDAARAAEGRGPNA